ncbi:MAG: acetate--CoA ligase family protein [Candidatus Symbiobacter sp.]|nr:acetate--CoA ligase family protein [Candidatus Symbiobacter sp.]
MLNPVRIAVVGASEREDSAGGVVMRQLAEAGYGGTIFPINPKRDQINGQKTYPNLAALPSIPDLAILAVPNSAIEGELAAMAAQKIPAAVIYASLVMEESATPPLMERVRQRLARDTILMCGGNGMGFYNFAARVWACAFATRRDHRAAIPPHNRPGNLALITHSGSVFNSLLDAEPRLDFALAVSAGQELSVSAADYLDYALEQDHIWTIGLVLETVRDPVRFVAALEKAAKLRKAVVILKLGRSAQAAELALSHSGALIGSHGAYQALFQAFGVCEVSTLSELAAHLLFFSHYHHPPYAPERVMPPGGLASIHDSGGERVLFVDLAQDIGVPFAAIAPATQQKLATRLEPGMLAVNPLDAWGTGRDNFAMYAGGVEDFATDPNVALCVAVGDRMIDGIFDDSWYGKIFRPLRRKTTTPLAVVSNHQGLGNDDPALRLSRDGVPVWDGVREFLLAVKSLFFHRDFVYCAPPPISDDVIAVAKKWCEKIAAKPNSSGLLLNEFETLQMLAEAGISANQTVAVKYAAGDNDDFYQAAEKIGYPLVLKSAAPGLAHKTEQGGVVLNIRNRDELNTQAQHMTRRLGPEMLLAPMIDYENAVEMMIGVSQDSNFGPIMLVGFGGIYAETDRDVIRLYPPVAAHYVEQRLRELRRYPILLGSRGKPAVAVADFARMVERVSLLAVALGKNFGDIDLNPVVVTPKFSIAVDGNVTQS